MSDLTKEDVLILKGYYENHEQQAVDWLQKRITELEAEAGSADVLISTQDKRITELKEAGRELLIDAMNLYSNYPNNFRNTVEEYFSDEIKVFGIPEGGADE